MSMNDFRKFGQGRGPEAANQHLENLLQADPQKPSVDVLKFLFSCIDLTSLNSNDNDHNIVRMCQQLNRYPSAFPEFPTVRAICIYPSLVPTVRQHLTVEGVSIASVSGGFPSSQTFPEIKVRESEMAVEAGATEIDMVISVGRFLQHDFQFVGEEIRMIKSAIGSAHLKVILETGLLNSYENIRLASLIALESGADFIKTSTGKTPVSASPEAVYAMTEALLDFHKETGIQAGIKPSGGIVTANEALMYYKIIHELAGKDWLSPSLFRLGASRLANNLLADIQFLETGKQEGVVWF
jgi:deoxyribose-phosphate aldolase